MVLVADGANSAWALCITYDEGTAAASGNAPVPLDSKRGKVDDREVPNDPEFAVCARLRKDRAEADCVPVYAVFTNDQLAETVQPRVASAAALQDPSVETHTIAS